MVYAEIKDLKRFMVEPNQDFNILMRHIRKALSSTELKLRYSSTDLENLIAMINSDKILLEISIIPKATNHEEFILWLASFIVKITDGPTK